jgi:alpha-tubulin suppressor-like RCC1 family protein
MLTAFSFASTAENRVFNWGRDAERDEGVGPVELSLAPLNGERVKLISAGYEHNLILTENGKAYTFGSGGSGQLGHGEKQEARQFDLKLVEALSDQNIVDGCAGGHHTIFLNGPSEHF